MSNEKIAYDHDSRMEAIDEKILDKHLEDFFRRWTPSDRDSVGYFHRDFHNLVRLIYRDAAKPYNEMTKQILHNMVQISTLTIVPK